MGCCLWSAIWWGWKAWVSPPSGVYAHGLQATRHPTSRCFKELYYDDGRGYCWGYQKDGQGTNVKPIIAAIPNTCVLLGTWFEHEPISWCMDFKQWPCVHGHCHALDQWWLEARYAIFLILDTCLLNNFNNFRGATYRLLWAGWGTFGWEFGPCCLWYSQPLWSQGSGQSLSCSWFLYTDIDYLQIVAINADNAANNDTMVEHLETLLQGDFVDFRPSDVRMRCMPHTVHLAALEVIRHQVDEIHL